MVLSYYRSLWVQDDRVHLSRRRDKGAEPSGPRGQERVEKKMVPFRKIRNILFYYSIDSFTLSLPQKKERLICRLKSIMLTNSM
jgi:hypothetical protein